MDPSLDHAEAKPLGRVLSEERERQGLSRAEAAQRLHMSAYQIEALEIGDYSRLPRGTFLRGFVRNYSKVLGLQADAMLERLAEAAPRTPSPEIVVHSQNIRFDPLGQRLANPYVKAAGIAVAVVALALAAMYWWLFIRPSAPAASAAKPAPVPAAQRSGPPQQIAEAPVGAAEPVAPSAAPIMVQEPPKAEEPAKGAAASARPAAEPAAPAKRARGERVIKLRFRGESWVEIRDGQGRVLLSQINTPGSEAEVAGRPPFTVVVGNAPDVTMLYDEREFPLEPHTKVAVARFTIQQ